MNAAADPIALLVDDEPVVLKLMARVIERAGYRVLTAADGGEALLLAEQAPGALRIAVFDATIPPEGAAGAASQVLALHPEAELVFTSGGALAPAEQACLDQLGGRFLPKPFAPRALAALVGKPLSARVARD